MWAKCSVFSSQWKKICFWGASEATNPVALPQNRDLGV